MRVVPDLGVIGLRDGSLLRQHGGLKEEVVHVWRHKGHELARVKPEKLACDGDDGAVFRSFFPDGAMPRDPTGAWSCTTYTVGGQLVGVRKWEVKRLETPIAGTGS